MAVFRGFYRIIRGAIFALVFAFGTHNAMAGTITCDAGYYLASTSPTYTSKASAEASQLCRKCQTGDYCPGGTFTQNCTQVYSLWQCHDVGNQTCPTNAPHSIEGRSSITQCYANVYLHKNGLNGGGDVVVNSSMCAMIQCAQCNNNLCCPKVQNLTKNLIFLKKHYKIRIAE